MIESVVAAFLLGLMGAVHCIGMCGGIAAALAFAIQSPKQKILILIAYNIGRVGSYALIGLLAGVLGKLFLDVTSNFTTMPILRYVAAVMMVLMGLYISGWWKVLTRLEKLGAHLWKVIQPIGQNVMPVDTLTKGLIFGAVWGWLPCGLVYSALAFSMTQAEPSMAAVCMFAFGLGTVPAVLVGGVMGEKLKTILQNRSLQRLLGMSLIFFGIWTAYNTWYHNSMSDHHSGHHASHKESSDEHQHKH